MKSDAVKKGMQQAPHRSLFNALGLTEEEMKEIDALDCGKHYYTQTQELLDKYASMAPDFNGQDDGKE